MKRMLDVLASGVLLLVCLLFLPIVVIAIRLSSPGPAIFPQPRVGRDEQTFTCYELQTRYLRRYGRASPHMRLTHYRSRRLGSFLPPLQGRRTPAAVERAAWRDRLVGPRPCLTSQTELIEARRRLGVFALTPGITGLAQVSGIDMSDPERLAKVDAQYANGRSFAGDLKLIWATLRGQGVGVDQVLVDNDAK